MGVLLKHKDVPNLASSNHLIHTNRAFGTVPHKSRVLDIIGGHARGMAFLSEVGKRSLTRGVNKDGEKP